MGGAHTHVRTRARAHSAFRACANKRRGHTHAIPTFCRLPQKLCRAEAKGSPCRRFTRDRPPARARSHRQECAETSNAIKARESSPCIKQTQNSCRGFTLLTCCPCSVTRAGARASHLVFWRSLSCILLDFVT